VQGCRRVKGGFLPDEKLPPRAAELLAAFEAVWVTLDRGILKDEEIVRAIEGLELASFCSARRAPGHAITSGFLVCRYDRLASRVDGAQAKGRPFRARVRERGAIHELSRLR
jgi:hypothetical protein